MNGHIRAYFDLLYPPEHRPDGYVSLFALPSKANRHFKLSDAELETAAAELDDAGENVFAGLGLRGRDPGPHSRGTKKDIIALPGFWLDIDIKGPQHAAENLPPDVAAVAAGILEPFGFDPTAVVYSGCGLHVYWLTERPIEINDSNRSEIANLSKKWQDRLIALAGERGWHCDATADLARVLRPVGTHNRKREPVSVQFVLEGGPRYEFETLRRHLTAKPSPLLAKLAQQPVVGVADPAVADAPVSLPSPDPDTLTQKDILDRLSNMRQSDRVKIIVALKAGQPFAHPGERDHTLQRVASWLAFCAPDAPPEMVAEVLRPSLETMERENPNDFLTIENAIDKIARAQTDARRIYANNRERDNRILDSAFRESRKRLDQYTATDQAPTLMTAAPIPASVPTASGSVGGPSSSGGVSTALTVAPPSGGTTEVFAEYTEVGAATAAAPLSIVTDVVGAVERQPEGVVGQYTPEELDYWADQQGRLANRKIDKFDFLKRWVIQRGEAFYFFVDGRYSKPLMRGELDNSLARDLRALPAMTFANGKETVYFIWTVPKANGDSRKKTSKEVLADISSVARGGVVIDLALEHSYYDPMSQTFYEAPCPVRPDLTPKYDPNVETWLNLLGGDEKEKLLDWVATVTQLHMPSCGLFLSGPASAGKSLLAGGLARLWTTGAPTKMDDAAGHFNDDLTRCPLVVADEYLPTEPNGKPLSTRKLRDLIAAVERPIRRKFMANASMRGAIRAMFLANNEDFLSMGDEVLGPDGLEAVASRFLHIPVTKAPRLFIESIGGKPKGTNGWVDRDEMARHALWLRDTRKVTPGPRFLVEGRLTKMHDLLSTQGTVPGMVVEFISRYLANPRKSSKLLTQHHFVVGNGELLINAPGMLEAWDDLMPNNHQPTLHKLSVSLQSMSKSNEAVRRERGGQVRRYWDLRPDMVLRWAEQHQVGDPDALRVKIFASEMTWSAVK